jgi:hypothetical protein
MVSSIQLAFYDKKLLHIQVPDNVSRVPKNIEDGHWKGNDVCVAEGGEGWGEGGEKEVYVSVA